MAEERRGVEPGLCLLGSIRKSRDKPIREKGRVLGEDLVQGDQGKVRRRMVAEAFMGAEGEDCRPRGS